MSYAYRLDRQNQMILQAQQSVAETEVVAESIVTNLESNREKIATVEGRVSYATVWNVALILFSNGSLLNIFAFSFIKVDDFQGIADSARRMVTSMSRRWWA